MKISLFFRMKNEKSTTFAKIFMTMSIRKHIPNTITCCNLISGCISIYLTLNGFHFAAALMIFAAAIFDFFDGFAARALDAKSPIGGELDSLSDVVSFGVAPSFILVHHLKLMGVGWMVGDVDVFVFLAFVLAAFAAVRLAKFNIDTRQTSSFLGLPVPAVGLFIASLSIMMMHINENGLLMKTVNNPYFFIGMILMFSWLMVSEVPFFSFKVKSLRFADNKLRYVLVVFAVVSFAVFQWVALPFIFLFYILLSVIFYRG